MLDLIDGKSTIGPMLRQVLEMQRRDEELTSHPRLQSYGAQLVELCKRRGDPLVWPVGEAAHRLAGAAALLSGGRVRLRGWSDDVVRQSVLLLCPFAATPLGVLAAARQARAMGASRVDACGIEVHGAHDGHGDVLGSYFSLEPAAHSNSWYGSVEDQESRALAVSR
jgi:hypothetical protein